MGNTLDTQQLNILLNVVLSCQREGQGVLQLNAKRTAYDLCRIKRTRLMASSGFKVYDSLGIVALMFCPQMHLILRAKAGCCGCEIPFVSTPDWFQHEQVYFIFLWGIWGLDRVRIEWLDECGHCLLWHTHTGSQTSTHSVPECASCCVWTKHLSALDLTLKHHIMLTFSYFSTLIALRPQWKSWVRPTLLREDDLWPPMSEWHACKCFLQMHCSS